MNHYIPGFEVTVRNAVLMQKGHSEELKTKRHNVVRTVRNCKTSSRGDFQGKAMIVLPILRSMTSHGPSVKISIRDSSPR
jgi:hypothetical protein